MAGNNGGTFDKSEPACSVLAMTTSLDLTKQAPRSPRELLGGYVILARTTDKCRALLNGNIGDFHFDCPLDKFLFGFKGDITGDQFKAVVEKGASDEEIVAWFNAAGTPKTAEEIKAFNEGFIARSPYNDPERKEWFSGECAKLNLDPATTTLFDWLDADDKTIGK